MHAKGSKGADNLFSFLKKLSKCATIMQPSGDSQGADNLLQLCMGQGSKGADKLFLNRRPCASMPIKSNLQNYGLFHGPDMIRSTPQKRPKNQKRKNTENRFFTPDRLGKPILRTGLKNQNFDCIALDNTPMHFLHARPILPCLYFLQARKRKNQKRKNTENQVFTPDQLGKPILRTGLAQIEKPKKHQQLVKSSTFQQKSLYCRFGPQ